MDAAQALTDLTEISSQIEAALVLDEDGSTMASTLDETRTKDLARATQELLAAVRRAAGDNGKELAQLEIATAEGSGRPAARPPHPRRRPQLVVDDADLIRAVREHAYLEGDFVLRSGKRSSYYLDKYRFETVPDVLEAIGVRLASKVAELEPDA